MKSSKTSPNRLLGQILFVVLLLVAVVALFGVLGAFKAQKSARQVTFKVNASGGYALITYDAGTEKKTAAITVTVPWEHTYNLPSGTQVFLTAANPSQSGQLTCTLLLDHSPWKSESKDAPKDGVACAGIVP